MYWTFIWYYNQNITGTYAIFYIQLTKFVQKLNKRSQTSQVIGHIEMDKQLSQQKIAQFKQAFQLFDKDNDNLVQVSQLPLLVRSLYQTPTEQELSKWMKQIDPKGQGKFQFSQFLTLMLSEYKEPETEDELIEAMLSIFKPKGPTITVKQFKNVMTNLGQKLSQDQLNELFKELKMQKQDNFNYEEFIRTILTR